MLFATFAFKYDFRPRIINTALLNKTKKKRILILNSNLNNNREIGVLFDVSIGGEKGLDSSFRCNERNTRIAKFRLDQR